MYNSCIGDYGQFRNDKFISSADIADEMETK